VKYLLNTNACIRYLNGRAPRIREHMRLVADADIAISAITLAEMFAGAFKSQHPERSRHKQSLFFARFELLPFTPKEAEVFGKIRAYLEQIGKPIGPYNLQIAATALSNQLILVTHNFKEFGRVPNLKIEDWET